MLLFGSPRARVASQAFLRWLYSQMARRANFKHYSMPVVQKPHSRIGVTNRGIEKYMGSNCGDTNTNTLVKNILNHARMTSLMWYHEVLSNYSVSHNFPYVIGETNSISVCFHFSPTSSLATSPFLAKQLLVQNPVSRPTRSLRRICRVSMVNRLHPLRRNPPNF